MRKLTSAVVLLILAGCATAPSVTPREYLDEVTAATITVAAEPWVYSEKRAQPMAPLMERRPSAVGALADDFSSQQRDFLSIYAIDVNRMGSHRQFLAVQQSLPRIGPPDDATSVPTLELQLADQVMSLQPTSEASKELGITQAPAKTDSRTSRWWYFPVSKEVLAAIAGSRDLQAAFVVAGNRTTYDIWQDGSAEFAGLTAILQ